MCFSVLASRLALQYMPTRSADLVSFGEQNTFARDAVDKHMRILDSVDQDAVLHITSPSEPVLAIAAALVMLPTPSVINEEVSLPRQDALNRYGSILEIFRSMCLVSDKLDILKGVRGEFVEDAEHKARCLLQPVRLDSILDSMVKLDASSQATVLNRINKVCDQLRDRHPTYSGNDDVHAWTHFTHFDHLKVQVKEISPEFLWYCWKRGVAIQTEHKQPGIDGIIPVFVGDLSQSLGDREERAADHMTFIAWEAKNRIKAGPSEADADVRKLSHAGPKLVHEQGPPRPSLTERGLLTLLMDLDIKENPARVKLIDNTDSLQVWVRGLGQSHNYSCLDTLQIREVVVALHHTIAARTDLETYNRIPDPMDLATFNALVVDHAQVNAAPPAAASAWVQEKVEEQAMDTE
ncbi:hypothetical protein [Sporisorium scitamineum]|uniref:Uncharacterized protein n=1 Tax=Sporisorium scitamineum TaxID=49012 RepID=A0A0F7RU46_9BASI|nr:hypothetical protein [Sporisorium scitamineum]